MDKTHTIHSNTSNSITSSHQQQQSSLRLHVPAPPQPDSRTPADQSKINPQSQIHTHNESTHSSVCKYKTAKSQRNKLTIHPLTKATQTR
jgi:hypothetical protein